MANPNHFIWFKKVIKDHDSKRNSEETWANLLVRTASADGLAPLGAMASAGTVMTKIQQRV